MIISNTMVKTTLVMLLRTPHLPDDQNSLAFLTIILNLRMC
uniref:Uncharacterized protein n=1 Tax=Anopheles albimanus TaxID=7167 RepID=A0A182FYQ2_ANOAL